MTVVCSGGWWLKKGNQKIWGPIVVIWGPHLGLRRHCMQDAYSLLQGVHAGKRLQHWFCGSVIWIFIIWFMNCLSAHQACYCEHSLHTSLVGPRLQGVDRVCCILTLLFSCSCRQVGWTAFSFMWLSDVEDWQFNISVETLYTHSSHIKDGILTKLSINWFCANCVNCFM